MRKYGAKKANRPWESHGDDCPECRPLVKSGRGLEKRKAQKEIAGQMLESGVTESVLFEIGAIPGIVLMRNNCGVATFGRAKVRYGLGPGSADFVGCYNGRFIAIEFKREDGGVQSAKQKRWQKMIEAVGGVYILARNVSDVRAKLSCE